MKKVNFFNKHLIESEESFFEHFLFSFAMAMWLLLTAIVLFIHSIIPLSFNFVSSSNVRKINEIMQKRHSIIRNNQRKKANQERSGEEKPVEEKVVAVKEDEDGL